MKFKYPKKILVGDTLFHIKYDYGSEEGASLSYPSDGSKANIAISMKNHKVNPTQFLNLLIHEFKEIIQIEQSTRLWRRGTDSYEFHYTHAEHTDMCCRLAGILTEFIK